MSRPTGPLTEDPRWTDDAKRNWEIITADLGKMWDEAFDTVRRANISRYCDYGEHWACDHYGNGEAQRNVRCMCEHHAKAS